ncbi:neuronal acetylcholine receptor subunit alpha-10-like isoform X2 [Acanthaster planci]|uniref:Neuronal acetylcholine receptor subunit alpha-10-like isoform X2 n=1 Tax=Acanthaster planci TaxID=133434 RepID=A0A8B7ZH37_ACAPL|nr:neuronal acetylcholine receptor subunit alpha-10-like isoform X2 [Acanthaster planci]
MMHAGKFWGILLIKVCLLVMPTGSQFWYNEFALYGGNEQKLYEDLMRNYNKKVRPVWNSSSIVKVSLALSVIQILEMDERNQILTTNVWIEQHWEDEKMRWDSDDYGGITILRIPATELWVPDITLYDNADSNDYVSTSRTSNALVNNNGTVDLWSKPCLLKSTCKIDVKFFPFDYQECSMKFGSWTYNSFQMDLTKVFDDADLSSYVPNEQWNLTYAVVRRHAIKYICCPEEYLDVTFYFGLQRKPLYYIYNLIMPCILLSSLAMLGFFMPYDVGVVKVSLSITLILSLTVFLLLVAEMMPRTSEEVPLIGQYYAATMFLISISTAMNVFVLNVNERGGLNGKEVPRILRTNAFEFLAGICLVGPCPNRKKRRDHSHHEAHELKYKVVNTSQGTAPISFQPPGSGGGGSSNGGRSVRFSANLHTSYPEHEILMDETVDHHGDSSERRLAKLERSVEGILKHMKNLQKRKEKQQQLKADWARVALVMDRVLLIIFVMCTCTTALVLLLQRSPDKVPPSLDTDS